MFTSGYENVTLSFWEFEVLASVIYDSAPARSSAYFSQTSSMDHGCYLYGGQKRVIRDFKRLQQDPSATYCRFFSLDTLRQLEGHDEENKRMKMIMMV
ncbi:hypothetical protein L2E82_01519 [Cichorium intybus]|uniref:Uncharacterized protein n=1 Tax=Cichorium intybus TaxID=13427 RepID=A0ACB9GZ19_CICIN|nr:hypothetical protein L2E82_01519 [Cichorium intybus]